MIEFRPLTADDLELLGVWLARPHVARWWVEHDDVCTHYLPAIEGRDPTDHYVIQVDGRDVGMIETYLCADHPEWEAVVQVGPGVAGVDILIGEEELTGRGLGPEILRAFVADHVTARGVVASADVENARWRRAFEKAGFRAVREIEEEGRPHVLLRLDR